MTTGQTNSDVRAQRLTDAATLLVALSAMVVAGLAIWDRVNKPDEARNWAMEDRVIEDWDAVIAAGQRLGPPVAEVTIVQFGDYECPFCRQAEQSLRALRKAYPEQVAVVYRHMPLRSSKNGYHAAQFAECAALQGMFEPVHRLLYSAISLDGLDLERLASEAGISDIEALRGCVNSDDVASRIETDRAVAEALNIRGVPTIIFQGTLLANPPDSASLFEETRKLLGLGS